LATKIQNSCPKHPPLSPPLTEKEKQLSKS